MKIVAKSAIEVNGYGIVKRGQLIDLPEELIDGRIAANFVKADNTPLAVDKAAEKTEAKVDEQAQAEMQIKRTIETLGRNGIALKLDEFGLTYKPTSKTEYLAKMLLRAQGEID